MFYIAICDDEKILCNQIEEFLEFYNRKEEKLKISIFYSSEKLYEDMKNGKHYDLIFLDIEFSGMNGIQIGMKIRKELKNERIQIVYISGKQEYAIELFTIRPMNFLVKPLIPKNIIDSVEQAMKLANIYDCCFEFQIGSENYRIPYGDIIYFESNNRKIKLYTQQGSKELYGRLNDIEKNTPIYFIRIHQSFLVNRYYITYWSSIEITLLDKISLPISQSYRKRINQYLLQSEGEDIL